MRDAVWCKNSSENDMYGSFKESCPSYGERIVPPGDSGWISGSERANPNSFLTRSFVRSHFFDVDDNNAPVFTPALSNGMGAAISSGSTFWIESYGKIQSLEGSAAGLNTQNQIIGYSYKTAGPTPSYGAFLFENGSTAYFNPPKGEENALIPKNVRGEIKGLSALSISNPDPKDGSIRVLLSGSFLIDPKAGTWASRYFVWQQEKNGQIGTITPLAIPDGVQPQSINANGLIAATGTIASDPSGKTHALLLLPVELRDEQDPKKPKIIQPLPKKDDGESDNDYIQRQLPDSCIAYITGSNAAPQMPRLVAKGVSGIKLRWRLEVEYKRGNGYRANYVQDFTRLEDTVRVPASSNPNDPTFSAESDQDWKIFQDWETEINGDPAHNIPGKGFFGGTAKLYVWPAGQPTKPTDPVMTFRIGGQNPDPQFARDFIDARGGKEFWYAYAIARHETYSRVREDNGQIRYYNQFYTSYQGGPIGDKSVDMGWAGWAKGWPLYNLDRDRYRKGPHKGERYQNGPGGYGMFQLTWGPKHPNDPEGTGANAFIPRRRIWNWQDNVIGTITELQGKTAPAQSLLNGLQAAYSEWPAISYEGGLSGLEAIVVTYYNGTEDLPITDRKVNGSKRQTCWTAEGSGSTRSWLFHQNSQNYVQSVNAKINNQMP